MRLIDADAAKEKLKEFQARYSMDYSTAGNIIVFLDAHCPTVVPQWINVKDRLPEKSGNYLVCSAHKGKALPRSAYFDTSVGWYDNAVTHWMPLPEPPE